MPKTPYGYFYQVEQRFDDQIDTWVIADGDGNCVAVCYTEDHAHMIATGLNRVLEPA